MTALQCIYRAGCPNERLCQEAQRCCELHRPDTIPAARLVNSELREMPAIRLPTEAPSSNQRVHELKCWPPYFANIYDGSKPFEIRWDDRNYRVGDTLNIREFNPETECYTGSAVWRRITYVFNSGNRFGLQPGWAVLGLAPAPETEVGQYASPSRESCLEVALRQWLHDFGTTNELSQRTRILLGVPHPTDVCLCGRGKNFHPWRFCDEYRPAQKSSPAPQCPDCAPDTCLCKEVP